MTNAANHSRLYCLLRRCVATSAFAMAMVFFGGFGSHAKASILQADFSAVAEDIVVAIEQGAGGMSTDSDAESGQSRAPESPRDDSQNTPFDALRQGQPTPSGGTSSSSSSSSGFSSGGAMSCVISAEILVNGDDASTRLAIGQSIFLPSPPGTDLLRPPQRDSIV